MIFRAVAPNAEGPRNCSSTLSGRFRSSHTVLFRRAERVIDPGAAGSEAGYPNVPFPGTRR